MLSPFQNQLFNEKQITPVGMSTEKFDTNRNMKKKKIVPMMSKTKTKKLHNNQPDSYRMKTSCELFEVKKEDCKASLALAGSTAGN